MRIHPAFIVVVIVCAIAACNLGPVPTPPCGTGGSAGCSPTSGSGGAPGTQPGSGGIPVVAPTLGPAVLGIPGGLTEPPPPNIQLDFFASSAATNLNAWMPAGAIGAPLKVSQWTPFTSAMNRSQIIGLYVTNAHYAPIGNDLQYDQVQATFKNHESAFSRSGAAGTVTCKPVSATSVQFYWRADPMLQNNAALGYKAYYTVGGTQDAPAAGGGTIIPSATSVTLIGLTAGTAYGIYLDAVIVNGTIASQTDSQHFTLNTGATTSSLQPGDPLQFSNGTNTETAVVNSYNSGTGALALFTPLVHSYGSGATVYEEVPFSDVTPLEHTSAAMANTTGDLGTRLYSADANGNLPVSCIPTAGTHPPDIYNVNLTESPKEFPNEYDGAIATPAPGSNITPTVTFSVDPPPSGDTVKLAYSYNGSSFTTPAAGTTTCSANPCTITATNLFTNNAARFGPADYYIVDTTTGAQSYIFNGNTNDRASQTQGGDLAENKYALYSAEFGQQWAYSFYILMHKYPGMNNPTTAQFAGGKLNVSDGTGNCTAKKLDVCVGDPWVLTDAETFDAISNYTSGLAKPTLTALCALSNSVAVPCGLNWLYADYNGYYVGTLAASTESFPGNAVGHSNTDICSYSGGVNVCASNQQCPTCDLTHGAQNAVARDFDSYPVLNAQHNNSWEFLGMADAALYDANHGIIDYIGYGPGTDCGTSPNYANIYEAYADMLLINSTTSYFGWGCHEGNDVQLYDVMYANMGNLSSFGFSSVPANLTALAAACPAQSSGSYAWLCRKYYNVAGVLSSIVTVCPDQRPATEITCPTQDFGPQLAAGQSLHILGATSDGASNNYAFDTSPSNNQGIGPWEGAKLEALPSPISTTFAHITPTCLSPCAYIIQLNGNALNMGSY